MIEGGVTANRQAVVAVDIIDGQGHARTVDFVLDTGFTGYLTLPAASIRQLALHSVGQRTFELANGELFDFEAYLATVNWHGIPADALVLESDSTPLLGMTLLWGSRVTLDALAGGDVVIEDLELER